MKLVQKLRTKYSLGLFKKVAGAKGLEPSAFCVTGRRYNQLNYAPVDVVALSEAKI